MSVKRLSLHFRACECLFSFKFCKLWQLSKICQVCRCCSLHHPCHNLVLFTGSSHWYASKVHSMIIGCVLSSSVLKKKCSDEKELCTNYAVCICPCSILCCLWSTCFFKDFLWASRTKANISFHEFDCLENTSLFAHFCCNWPELPSGINPNFLSFTQYPQRCQCTCEGSEVMTLPYEKYSSAWQPYTSQD